MRKPPYLCFPFSDFFVIFGKNKMGRFLNGGYSPPEGSDNSSDQSYKNNAFRVAQDFQMSFIFQKFESLNDFFKSIASDHLKPGNIKICEYSSFFL